MLKFIEEIGMDAYRTLCDIFLQVKESGYTEEELYAEDLRLILRESDREEIQRAEEEKRQQEEAERVRIAAEEEARKHEEEKIAEHTAIFGSLEPPPLVQYKSTPVTMSRSHFALRQEGEDAKMEVVDENPGEEWKEEAFRFASHLFMEKKMDFLTMFPW